MVFGSRPGVAANEKVGSARPVATVSIDTIRALKTSVAARLGIEFMASSLFAARETGRPDIIAKRNMARERKFDLRLRRHSGCIGRLLPALYWLGASCRALCGGGCRGVHSG